MVLRRQFMNQFAFFLVRPDLVEIPIGIEWNGKDMTPSMAQDPPYLLMSPVRIGDMLKDIAGQNILKFIVSKVEIQQVLMADASDYLAGLIAIAKILTALVTRDQG